MKELGTKLIVIFSIGFALMLAAVITLSVLFSEKTNELGQVSNELDQIKDEVMKKEMCTTKACIDAASMILTNIDTSKNPCEDFNQFACGGFLKTKILPDDSTSIDSFTDLRNRLAYSLSEILSLQQNQNDPVSIKNAKNYYRSCMDEDGIEANGVDQMRHVLIQELGGSPMLDSSLNPNNEDPIEKLLKFMQRGLRPFIDVFISSNPKESNAYALRLQQANWYLSKESYDNPAVMSSYKTLMKTLVTNLAVTSDIPDQDFDNILALEKEFVSYILNAGERRNQTYQNNTIQQLEQLYPGFPWTRIIVEGLFGQIAPEVRVAGSEPILVVDFRFLTGFVTVFNRVKDTQRKDLYNLMMWYMIKGRTNFLPKLFRNAQLEFDKVYTGATSIAPRTRTCSNAINDRMPYAVGRLYVENYFAEEAKKDMDTMIANILDEFKVMLGENEWMDEQSKRAAREKAEFMDTKVAYPDYTYNDTYLDTIYKDYQFSLSDYLKNSLTITEVDYRKDLKSLRDKRDRTDWISGPAVVNAFYSSSNNQITFPAGILQQPFYHVNSPNYLNYGGIGVVIGHEITHGFDDQGRKYDKNGVFYRDDEEGLWTNQTITNYLGKAQCIVDQYSNYEAKQVNMNVRGFQTQGENIADNGGMKESYRAYKKWEKANGREKLLPGLSFNQDQLFFINYAQIWCIKITDAALKQRIETGVHSPGEFRIVGPTSNSYDFAQAFNCKSTSYNNPDKKCSVW